MTGRIWILLGLSFIMLLLGLFALYVGYWAQSDKTSGYSIVGGFTVVSAFLTAMYAAGEVEP